MAKECETEIGEAVLRDHHREPVLDVEREELTDDGEEEERRIAREPGGVPTIRVAVDRDLEQPGLNQHERGRDRQHERARPEGPPVGMDELPEPAHDLRVIAALERLLGVDAIAGRSRPLVSGGAQISSSSAVSCWRWNRSA